MDQQRQRGARLNPTAAVRWVVELPKHTDHEGNELPDEQAVAYYRTLTFRYTRNCGGGAE